MKLKPNTLKALEEGFALVLYQDDEGVHIGLIEHGAIAAARKRKVTEEEAQEPQFSPAEEGAEYYAAGFLDTQGGQIKPGLDFTPVWENIASMFVDDTE